MANGGEPGPEPHAPLGRLQKGLIGAIAILLGLLIGVVAYSLAHGGQEVVSVRSSPHRFAQRELPHPATRTSLPPASAGDNGSAPVRPPSAGGGGAVLSAGAPASFERLAASLGGSIGLAVAPLGAGAPQQLGSFQDGHAWSSIKVPILVTLMREQPSGLSSEEQQWASSALTASDNEAAASLFGKIEAKQGGLEGASQAVQQVLAEAGDTSTAIATAPPPPGAVSTYGQTEWSLGGSVEFYRALACGRLLDPAQTEYVLGLMEQVIPEQRWGLGEAGFPAGVRVSFKAGWGPEGSAGGPYLVRQSGILRRGSSGAVVTMMAEDSSGSFEAGVGDLNEIGVWLREHLRLAAGSCA
jgi:hypothetical protein